MKQDNINQLIVYEDDKRKNELMEFEFYPSIEDVDDKDEYTKVPLSELSALGMAFSTLPESMRTVTTTVDAGENVYKAIIKPGTHLAAKKDGTGFISTMIGQKGIEGQASLVPVDKVTSSAVQAFNPTMAFAAVMMMNVDHKLDEIQKSQQKIISTLDTQEHGQILGNIRMLFDTVKSAKLRWNDQTFKDDYRSKAIDIKQAAYQNIEMYKDRLGSVLKKKNLIHIGNESVKYSHEIADIIKFYRLSIFMYSYASFVEVLLGNNYSSDVIKRQINLIKGVNYEYKLQYSKAYNILEEYTKNSIGNQMLKGLSNASSGIGESIAKVPVINKGPVDEALISLGKGMKSLNNDNVSSVLKELRKYKSAETAPFDKQLKKMDILYNKEVVMLVDDKNMYIRKENLLN